MNVDDVMNIVLQIQNEGLMVDIYLYLYNPQRVFLKSAQVIKNKGS